MDQRDSTDGWTLALHAVNQLQTQAPRMVLQALLEVIPGHRARKTLGTARCVPKITTESGLKFRKQKTKH